MKRSFCSALILSVAFVFGAAATADAKAKIRFHYPGELDEISIVMRATSELEFEPLSDSVLLMILNVCGTVYSEAIPPSSFVANRRETLWRYVREKDGTPQIHRATIKPRTNRRSGLTEYALKLKVAAEAGLADPSRNTDFTENDLDTMLMHLHLGAESFDLAGAWKRFPADPAKALRGWKRAEKYLDGP